MHTYIQWLLRTSSAQHSPWAGGGGPTGGKGRESAATCTGDFWVMEASLPLNPSPSKTPQSLPPPELGPKRVRQLVSHVSWSERSKAWKVRGVTGPRAQGPPPVLIPGLRVGAEGTERAQGPGAPSTPCWEGGSFRLAPRPQHKGNPLPTLPSPPNPGMRWERRLMLPVLRKEQTSVFSEEWKVISTHRITLGTAPIGGHRATEQASRHPAEPCRGKRSCWEGRGAGREVSAHQEWPSPRKAPCPPPPPGPQPCSSRQLVSPLYLCHFYFQSLLPQVYVSRTEPSEPSVLSTWHIC